MATAYILLDSIEIFDVSLTRFCIPKICGFVEFFTVDNIVHARDYDCCYKQINLI